MSDSTAGPNPSTRPAPREALARRLWDAAAPAGDSPGRAYLAGRFAWPPTGIGPEPPKSVRWLAASETPAADRAANWYGLPNGATGALVFAWCAVEALRPYTWTIEREIGHSDTWEALGKPTRHRRRADQQMGFLKLVDRHARFRLVRDPPISLRLVEERGRYRFVLDDDSPEAASLLAVSTDGEPVPWFGEHAVKVRAVGTRTGATFLARRLGTLSEPLHIAEGEADALALSIAPWTGRGAVAAVGGTSGIRRAAEFPGSGPVVLHADGDRAGRAAVLEAAQAIRLSGREARIEFYSGGPADALAEILDERAAIRVQESGEDREAAMRTAWGETIGRER